MRPPSRATRAAATCLFTALVLTGCAGEDEPDDTTSSPTVSVTPTSDAGATGGSTPSAEPTPDDAQAISLTVTGGEVTGDTGRVEVPLGTTVRLSITSDAPDEVHVHGFELTQAVSPGQTTQLEFVADQTGVFEVELHDAGTVLTRLQVQ